MHSTTRQSTNKFFNNVFDACLPRLDTCHLFIHTIPFFFQLSFVVFTPQSLTTIPSYPKPPHFEIAPRLVISLLRSANGRDFPIFRQLSCTPFEVLLTSTTVASFHFSALKPNVVASHQSRSHWLESAARMQLGGKVCS